MIPTKLYCVIGQPIAHSLSPLVHNRAFAEVGWPGTYLAFAQTAESLPAFFQAFRTLPIAGCNITLPFKTQSMAHVDRLTDRARAVGAINTVWRDGEDRLVGDNTDVPGFMAPLKGSSFASALVLGAGGVSRAVLAGLKELGVESVRIANRSPEKARALAEEFGVDFLPWEERCDVDCDLVVNATSLGMRGAHVDETPYPRFGERKGLAYDIVYTPKETRFLREAAASGWRTQSGIAMFVEQAREAFRLWTGREMPAAGAYEAVERALAGRGSE